MFRQTTLYVLSVTVLAICVGCDTSTHEDRRAAVARAGLMPGATPASSSLYTQNQSEVKLAPERTISYEPLESFRGKAASARHADGKTDGKTAKAGGKSKRKSKGGKKGPIGKLKEMFSNIKIAPRAMGGSTPGAVPPGKPTAADDDDDDDDDADAADDDEDDADDDDEDDTGDEEDDDDGDDVSGGDGPGLGPQGPTPGGGTSGPGGGRKPR